MQTEVLDDHGRGLVHEDAGARAARMRHQVDEDVEPIVGDALGGGEVVAIGKPDEGARPLAKRVRDRVLVRNAADRICERLESRPVVPAHDFEHDPAHNVVAEVGGQITDPQRALAARGNGAGRRREVGPAFAPHLHERVVRPIEAQQVLPRDIVILETGDDAREDLRVGRPERPFERKLQILLLEGIAGHHAGHREADADHRSRKRGVRLEAQEIVERLLLPSALDQRVAEQEPERLVGRLELACAPQAWQRLRSAREPHQRDAEVAPCRRRVGLERRGHPEAVLGVREAAELAVELAERERRCAPARTQHARAQVGLFGLHALSRSVERDGARVVRLRRGRIVAQQRVVDGDRFRVPTLSREVRRLREAIARHRRHACAARSSLTPGPRAGGAAGRGSRRRNRCSSRARRRRDVLPRRRRRRARRSPRGRWPSRRAAPVRRRRPT